MAKITYIDQEGSTYEYRAIMSAVGCPNCHKHIIPTPLCIRAIGRNRGHMMVQCTDLVHCKACFVLSDCVIESVNCYMTTDIFKATLIAKSFKESILELSLKFVEIYNQSFVAEQQNLLQICGVGYRKALEFIIKDFCVKYNADDAENIKAAPLM